MKKCIRCGKEIPDDAEFCGFCGTRQPESESQKETNSVKKTTESDKHPALNQKEEQSPEDNSENANVETTDIDEKEISEDVKNSPEVENLPEDEKQQSEDHIEESSTGDTDQKQESVKEEQEIKDAEIVEQSSETNPETNDSEKKQSDAETVKKSEDQKKEKKAKRAHKDWKKSLPKANVRKEDFQALMDLVKNPTEKQGITNTTTWIILVFAWITNWIAFGSFGAGFVSLLIVLIGLIFINWLTLKDHATFGETVRNSAEVIFPPSLFVFLGGLFIRNIKAGAEIYAFHSIFTTAFIGMFFLTAAMILFLYMIIKKYEMKTWQIVLILTVVISLLYWYLLTSGMFSLIA